ncbi:hypothetical protein F5X96DRAFT_673535 [Biscogniauxia mediterranea]|nr:hypothetical protein F5X96DRAFT_673535 [Biscogniauxia mediterranea]
MFFFSSIITLYMVLVANLLNVALARPSIYDAGHASGVQGADAMVETAKDHVDRGIKIPDGPVWRCNSPNDELGPAPPVEDCRDVIQQFAAIPGDITVKLVEACQTIVSGNCTGSVCPQRQGSGTIPAALAAEYMSNIILDNCISKGLRGWWNEGQQYGIGLYLN